MSASSGSQPAALMPGGTARDPVMDLVRVLCVAVVVVGHMLMIGAAVVPGRGLVVEKTLLETNWIGPVTWIAQIMPLFFVVGGFVGIGAWRRLEASGGTAADFIRSRILRLARPSIALFAALALAVLAMHLTGVDPESIRLIGLGISSPLWFLAAYAFAQAYLPGLATFHALSPGRTLATLAAGALVFDILRFTTGIEALGLLDMTFVWLFAQQLGFWIADGWFTGMSRATVALIGAGAYLMLFSLVGIAGYPGNMLDNLNPPTFAIVVLAVGQTCLLVLAHPALVRLMALRPVRLVVATVGSRLMTIYLWHLPVLALVIGLLLLSPLPTPAAGSAAWWLTRPLIFLVMALVLAGISMLFGRLERPSSHRTPASDWSTGLAAGCMVIPPFAVIVFGLDFTVAVSGALVLTAAVLLQRPLPARQRERGRSDPSTVTP